MSDSHLPISLSGPGWRADLDVAPPSSEPRTVSFHVPALGYSHGPLTLINATVLYTEATNRLASHWQRWHVKVYRCANQGDADALRAYLRQQAAGIQEANAAIKGTARVPIEPPWAVVPVHIVRGDGEQDSADGQVLTQLAVPAEELMERVRRTLPSWFPDGPPSPELCLLAVSPFVEHLVWPAFKEHPAVEQLVDFFGLAVGLDTLHGLGIVHCDVKPDNVCRYRRNHLAGFVLIDTDAATRLSPPPVTIRSTITYEYSGVRAWRHHVMEHGPTPVDPNILRAHDRFGFALVVLTALTGRDWVERSLLWTGNDRHADARPADDRRRVIDALRNLWIDTSDRQWGPLIHAMSEPFGPQIERADWSAAQWVERLIEAERDCAPPSRRIATSLRRASTDEFAHDIAQVRAEARRELAPRKEQVMLGYAAVQRRAMAVATRQATVTMTLAGGAVIGAAFLLMLVLWGLG